MAFGTVIHDVLRCKYKGCDYSVGETYDSLIWGEENQIAKPSEAQLNIDIADYLANREGYDYKALREANVPSPREQLAMLWRAMDANEIPRAPEFYNAIKTVYDQYPPPSE